MRVKFNFQSETYSHVNIKMRNANFVLINHESQFKYSDRSLSKIMFSPRCVAIYRDNGGKTPTYEMT